MPVLLASFGCGLLFGIGLLVSGMNDPLKVLGFLDIFGAWDATLAFVMAGAVAVSSSGFALAKRRGRPMLTDANLWPTRAEIDWQLLVGGTIFGLGWGLVGLCPGPALVDLAGFGLPIVAFVAAMGAGTLSFEFSRPRSTSGQSLGNARPVTDG
ncbi:DUF6691 family protein [Bradyrhizobium sp. USDA 313]|uniref:DUF6691 family protein n=1 Tax=Bradyrhizobium sp. USDA 313 TaxID=3156307 RepID=UPI0035166990